MARIVESPDAGYTVRDQLRMEAASRYFRWQYTLAEHEIGQRILEVGCGVGNVTNLLLNRELVVGIDVETACVKARSERFSEQTHIISQCMDVLDPAFPELARYGFDSVVCLNVLEHISDDRKALEHMGSVLRPRGKIILLVPAFDFLYGPIDSKLGHYRRYSRRRVADLAQSLGFEVAIAHYMNVAGFFGWWLNAKLLRKSEQSEGQIRLFDSVIVPIQSRLEAFVHPPFGQSIFAVLRKPARCQA
jgi:SAM-dependent methyltransferase